VAPDSKEAFDRKKLADFLRKWYDSQVKSALRKPKPAAEAAKNGCSVFDIQPEMSSTKAVRVLLELTDILEFEPSKAVIKKGGYRSEDEFVKEMMDRIEQEIVKRFGSKPPAAVKAQKEVKAHAQV
jgi:hypothetical protein